MRAFLAKRSRSGQARPGVTTRFRPVPSRPQTAARTLRHQGRKSGEQVVSKPSAPRASTLTSTKATPRRGHDFSKIRVERDQSGHEQEASQIADHVIRTNAIAALRGARESNMKGGAGPVQQPTPVSAEASGQEASDQHLLATGLDAAAGRGQPIPAKTRDLMEPHLGKRLGGVRLHRGSEADKMSRSLGADAFAWGRHVFVRPDRYEPETRRGQWLLAHELTHVLQQEKGPPRIQPLLSFHTPKFCPGGEKGAPPDALARLATHDRLAGQMCLVAALVTRAEAGLAAAGIPGPARAAYQQFFGLPPQDQGGKFVNRLTGERSSDLGTALAGELRVTAWRIAAAHRLLSQPIIYTCVEGKGTAFGVEADCTVAKMRAGQGLPGAIVVCPAYWTTDPENAIGHALMIAHEAMHMIDGGISDTASGTPNQSFFVAQCYEEYIAALNAASGSVIPTKKPCPTS